MATELINKKGREVNPLRRLLNTLYITVQGAYLRQDHENIVVQVEKEEKLRVPLHHIGHIVLFGRVMVSSGLIRCCGREGISLVYLGEHGDYVGRFVGFTSGNVLLRLDQFRKSQESGSRVQIARNIVAGKVQNARANLLRSARDADCTKDETPLRSAAQSLANTLRELKNTDDLDRIRGYEGDAAKNYFAVFPHMVRQNRETFTMDGRTRRPPRDPMNALLSYLYALLLNDCLAAVEGTGLDPQVGFLHHPRPGRPSLALDLMEEFRPVLADRLSLTLVNRQQVTPDEFIVRSGGAVEISEKCRKGIIVAYQQRKQDEVTHPLLETKVALGLIPHIQARLLARTLRGESEGYTPFVYR